jgi:hypothetical protein
LIVDGEPNVGELKDPNGINHECFPPSLRFALSENGELTDKPDEPLAADVRRGKDRTDATSH